MHESVIHSSIAQSVEHAAVNRAVVGSSPTRGVKNKDRQESCGYLSFWDLLSRKDTR